MSVNPSVSPIFGETPVHTHVMKYRVSLVNLFCVHLICSLGKEPGSVEGHHSAPCSLGKTKYQWQSSLARHVGRKGKRRPGVNLQLFLCLLD